MVENTWACAVLTRHGPESQALLFKVPVLAVQCQERAYANATSTFQAKKYLLSLKCKDALERLTSAINAAKVLRETGSYHDTSQLDTVIIALSDGLSEDIINTEDQFVVGTTFLHQLREERVVVIKLKEAIMAAGGSNQTHALSHAHEHALENIYPRILIHRHSIKTRGQS